MRPTDVLRRLLRGDEVERARRWQQRSMRDAVAREHEDADRFKASMASRAGQGRILLGRARDLSGDHYWCGVRLEEFLGWHGWITGSTGSGKTLFAIACLLQILLDGRFPVVTFDLKGELTQLLMELVIPYLVSLGEGERLLRQLRIIRPFGTHLPMLRVTDPEPGVPRSIQAYNLASALEDALGDDLGTRMLRVFLRLCALAIELRYPLTAIKRWLEAPALFARDAQRSADPELREYARTGLPRESRPAIDALLARLDSFLFLDDVKLALSAPRCVNCAESLEGGTTIVDLGNPPAGAERVQRFWAGILMGRFARAILSRPVTDATPQVWCPFDEVQEALHGGQGQAEQLARLLALARSRRVGVALINQQPGQLAAVDPTLVKVLRTNATIEVAFRANHEDARTLAQSLPLPPHHKNAAEARLELATALTQMPNREYLLWIKQAPFRPQRVRSPRLDLAAIRRAAEQVPAETHDQIARGTMSMDRDALAAHAAAEWTRLGLSHEADLPIIAPEGHRRHPRLG